MSKNNVLPLDLIIHPGLTLEELLNDREMKQNELAIRCGVTEKHISAVISGKSNISAAFAKKLEYVFGIGMDFWLNLQNLYDKELLEYKEENEITEEEIAICKNLKEVEKYFVKYKFIKMETTAAGRIIAWRQVLGVANLCDITQLACKGAFRTQQSNNINYYALFAWQVLCEKLGGVQQVTGELNLNKLVEEIPNIKKLSSAKSEKILKELTAIFAKCGVAFVLLHNFKGAPVQGFIKDGKEKTILGITIRQKWKDVFWFTLFHEIGHLLHGDNKRQFVDLEHIGDNELENRADKFARDTLIDKKAWQNFIKNKVYTQASVNAFAKQQGIDTSIVWGRLAKEGVLSWPAVAKYRGKYEWQSNSSPLINR